MLSALQRGANDTASNTFVIHVTKLANTSDICLKYKLPRVSVPPGCAADKNGRSFMETNNKQLVSIRLSRSDFSKIKHIARRLGVRDSDVIRFAIRSTLGRLGPLHDTNLGGRDLLPVFVELGGELTTYFEIDSSQLDVIINDGIEHDAHRVASDDIKLLTMAAMPEHYIYLRLKEVAGDSIDTLGVNAALRQYLYDKYLQGETVNRTKRAPSEKLDSD